MIFVRDYNIDEAREILKSQDPDNLKIIPHVEERWLERDFKINYTVDCLINKIPLSISKTYYNRFKLISHETKPTMDLYVIIEISDDENVSVITVYPEEKKRREHERKRR